MEHRIWLAAAVLFSASLPVRTQTEPVRTKAYWRSRGMHTLWVERVFGPPPPEVLQYLGRMNAKDGFVEVPAAAQDDASYDTDLRNAIEGLPAIVKAKSDPKLFAVMLAKGVGSTGFTDVTVDGQGRQSGAFMILDVDRTNTGANAWATAKESSPFKPDGKTTLAVMLEEPKDDSRSAAIQYILLHELGHVLAGGARFHPRWDQPISSATHAQDYPFFALSWSVRPRGGVESLFSGRMKDFGPLHFYQVERSTLSATRMPEVYSALETTPFVTLHGSTNPFDDFAEAFASYVHVVLMKKPYRIVVSRGGTVVKTYGSCWGEKRCAAKRRLLEEFLGR